MNLKVTQVYLEDIDILNDDIDDIYIVDMQEDSVDSIKNVETGELAWLKDDENYAFVRIEKQKEPTKQLRKETREIKYKE